MGWFLCQNEKNREKAIMRKRLFEIIEVSQDNDRLSIAYDIFMMLVILISIIPLAFVTNYPIFDIIDKIIVAIIIIEVNSTFVQLPKDELCKDEPKILANIGHPPILTSMTL